jgi:hypothetical protein
MSKGKLRKSAKKALPNLEVWPDLDNNNNPYLAYRFGIAMAGAPTNNTANKEGPIGTSFTTIGYTDCDREITQAAAKVFGIKSKNLSGHSSLELDTANTKSPVNDWNKASKKKIKEAGTSGATTSGNVATLGGSPNILVGRRRQSWSGSPGKMANKGPKPPKIMMQKPGTNALDSTASIVAEKDSKMINYNEYSDEVGMIRNNLHTIARACKDLHDLMKENENMPEWVQEKVSAAKGMLSAAAEYMKSQHAENNIQYNSESVKNYKQGVYEHKLEHALKKALKKKLR